MPVTKMDRFLAAMVGFLAIVTYPCFLLGQKDDGVPSSDAQILSEVREHNELMGNIEYLSDIIGPRLTGSAQQVLASTWAEKKFKDGGLTNVHQEKWVINHSWVRGTASGKIVSPVSRNLTAVSAGWSPSTDGIVQGQVVYVNATSASSLEEYRDRLRGAIVIIQEPGSITPPYETGHPLLQFPLREPTGDREAQSSTSENFYETRAKFFKAQGVLAVLRDSANPYNLLRMSNVSEGDYDAGLVPTAFLPHEDYSLIWRLLKRGTVRLELSITNGFSPGPVETSNTVAEIQGTEKPDEIVMLGAHIDSWDLASGSTDNGTGVAAVLEAARALAALKLKPKRTIRFVLFSGEEQGEVGSTRYVAEHKDELPRISAILVNDTGTGRIITIGVHENYGDIEPLSRILAPISASLQLLEPKISRTFGSDYAPFNAEGVPGFSCIGDAPEYVETQHTQSDTFDKVSESGITQAAQVMAVWAFNTAQYPTMLPRRVQR